METISFYFGKCQYRQPKSYRSIGNFNNMEKLVLTTGKQQLQEIQEKIDDITKYNKEVFIHNSFIESECKKTVRDILENNSYMSQAKINNVLREVRGPSIPQKPCCTSVYFRRPVGDIESFPFELIGCQITGENLIDLYEKIEDIIVNTHEKKMHKQRVENTIQAKAIELFNTTYHNDENIQSKLANIDYDSQRYIDVLVEEITEREKALFYEKNVKGQEIPIDCCPECDVWIGGDRLCKCGIVRIEYDIVGNIVEGFECIAY